MKKLCVGFLVCFIAMFSCIIAFAAGTTMCILPEDFEGSMGTFSVVNESAEIGPFRGKNLRGATDKQYANTIPAQLGFDITEKGEYTVYVHSRDFNTNTGERFFKVTVGKNSLDGKKLGAHGKHGWAWEVAGTIALDKSSNVLIVYDSSGFYARTDMIIISSDKNLKLPETHEEMQKMAENHRIVKSAAELTEFLVPNQVFKAGKFYTAANVEVFSDTGTWFYERNSWLVNDTPLKDRYLRGLGGPNTPEAKNAKVTFAVPSDGEYYLWVRTKDFSTEQGTRLFNAVIDGTMLDGDLGQHGIDGWGWERLKAGKLTRGYHVLEFADTYKYHARFDMFMITDDKDFVPENKQLSAIRLLYVAKFQPDAVVPDIICPVKAEPIGKETVTYPMRPATEYAVSVNGTYIDCKTDFSGKYPMISAKSAFMALGATLAYETDKSICFAKDNKSYLFTVDDPFCLNAKKKIELRCAPKLSEGEILIPVSFLSKLTGVKAKVNGKDVEITHRIWK